MQLREHTFDTSARFLSNATKIIRNHLLDLAKKHKPELVPDHGSDSSGPNPLRDLPDTTDDPAKMAQWGEIHSLIAALPDDERQLFDLILYQGLTPAEVSRLLGIPPTTLSTRWQHARVRFMQRFGNESPF